MFVVHFAVFGFCNVNEMTFPFQPRRLSYYSRARAPARSHAHISIRKLNIGCHRVHSPSHTTIFLWHRPTFKWNWLWWWWHHEQDFGSFFFSVFADAIAFTPKKNKESTRTNRFGSKHHMCCIVLLHYIDLLNRIQIRIWISAIILMSFLSLLSIFVAIRSVYFPLYRVPNRSWSQFRCNFTSIQPFQDKTKYPKTSSREM